MADTPDYARDGAQPPPIPAPPGAVSAHDAVIRDAIRHHAHLPGISLLADGMQARKAYGLKKYTSILWAGNGRNHLADVLDETEDKIVYMWCAMEHEPALRHELWRPYLHELEFLLTLRVLIHNRKATDA